MRPEVVRFDGPSPVQTAIREVENMPYHWHRTVEIIYVLQGHIHVSFGSEEHCLQADDIAVVNVNEVHRIYDTSPGNRVLHVHVDPDYCERCFPGFSTLLFYCCSSYENAEA